MNGRPSPHGLRGRRILVTRARDQAPKLVALLEAHGAETVAMPTIRIAPPDDPAALEAACDAAASFDWIVVTSANGAHAFLSRLAERGTLGALAKGRMCAVGPSTRDAVEGYGIRVDVMPAEYRADALLAAIGAVDDVRGRRVLLPRGQLARAQLPDALRAAGAEVHDVVAYRTLPADEAASPEIGRLLGERIDAVTFTSASTVRNFIQIVGPERARELLNRTVVATIGPVTAEAIHELGVTPAVVPADYTVPALVDALVAHFSADASRDDEP